MAMAPLISLLSPASLALKNSFPPNFDRSRWQQISGKTLQNVFLSQHFQQNRQLDSRYSRDYCALSMHSTHPLQGWKIACAGMPAVQLQTLAAHQISHWNRASFATVCSRLSLFRNVFGIFLAAAQRTSAVPSSKKVDFHKLQKWKNAVGEESHLAIETSGHGALKENTWIDEGAYLMVKLLNKLASARASGSGNGSKVLTDLIDGLEEPAVSVELRLKIDQNHEDLKGVSFLEYGKAVLKHLENVIVSDPRLQKAPVNYEGVLVSSYGWWFLRRPPLHDPVMALNIEAPKHEDAVKLGLFVLAAVNDFPALDTSELTNFVQQS